MSKSLKKYFRLQRYNILAQYPTKMYVRLLILTNLLCEYFMLCNLYISVFFTTFAAIYAR